MKLPKHIAFSITHNDYRTNYETAEEYIKTTEDQGLAHSMVDREEMLRTGEIWELHWYPDTPVGFIHVMASTLEKALAVANRE